MSKIIKVSTDLEVTVHDFPQGTIREQNRQLCELIGNGCEMIEHVTRLAAICTKPTNTAPQSWETFCL